MACSPFGVSPSSATLTATHHRAVYPGDGPDDKKSNPVDPAVGVLMPIVRQGQTRGELFSSLER
jgi:hypothetical protein